MGEIQAYVQLMCRTGQKNTQLLSYAGKNAGRAQRLQELKTLSVEYAGMDEVKSKNYKRQWLEMMESAPPVMSASPSPVPVPSPIAKRAKAATPDDQPPNQPPATPQNQEPPVNDVNNPPSSEQTGASVTDQFKTPATTTHAYSY